MKTTAIITATLGLALGSPHAQTVPLFINYQGRVTDSAGVGLGTGTPVNRKMIFRIFKSATGNAAGDRLWSEQQTVTIANGEFSVLLGLGSDAVYNSFTETPRPAIDTVFTTGTTGTADRYLEIVVDNDDNTLDDSDVPISPRQQITSTAYSFRARSADTIASGTDLQLNGSSNYGLGYYGTGRAFNGTAVDGPVLYGNAGGGLGSNVNGAQNLALRWNAAGQVGIGTTTPAEKLDVIGNARVSGNVMLSNTSASGAAGVIQLGSARIHTYGQGNVFVGEEVGNFTMTGSDNVGIGKWAMASNNQGSENIAIGNEALALNPDGHGNVAIGAEALGQCEGNGNLGLGFGAGNNIVSGSNNIAIRHPGEQDTSNTIWLGEDDLHTRTFLAGTVHIGTNIPSANKLVLQGDDVSATPQQLLIHGATNTDRRLTIGYNTDTNRASLQAYSAATTTTHLLLNPAGGNVGIGTTTPTEKLDVVGNAKVNGKLVATGNVGIGTNTPTEKLDVVGNAKVNGKLVAVGEENLRIVRGTVNGDATIQSGSGFTVARYPGGGTNGHYKITFTNQFTGKPSVTATSEWTNVVPAIKVHNQEYFEVNLSGDPHPFHFIAIGER